MVEEEKSPKRARILVDNISLTFGAVQALKDIDVDINEDEFLAIIGPNGSGKTCLLNCISGYYHPQKGEIYFNGRRLVGLAPHRIAEFGIGRTFQNIELFTGLTVLENLMAARHVFIKEGILTGAVYFRWAHNEEKRHLRTVEEIIDFLEIQAIRNSVVGVLPYGLRKRVELGRALALEPEVLLLDEPLAGMNLDEKEDIVRFILDIYEGAEFGYESEFLKKGVKTIVLVEHDMGAVMDVAERIVVFDFGNKIAEGSSQQIKGNPLVIKSYLGKEL